MKIDAIKNLLTKQCILFCLFFWGLNFINPSVYAQEDSKAEFEEILEAEEEEGGLEPEEDPIVPTRYQWLGLFAVTALFIIVSIKTKAHKLTMDGEFVEYQLTKTFNIPLHKSVFKFALFLTGAASLIGFAICLAIFDSVNMSDIIGVSIAGPLFAYLIHLLYLMERHHRESNE